MPDRTLVLGGIRSGKSQWAEAAIAGAGDRLRYIATGIGTGNGGDDPAWTARIAEHRARRLPNWDTVESADVAGALRNSPLPTLVDDLGSWLTAVLDRRGWETGCAIADVDDLLDAVESFTAPLVLVSPEVGLSVVPATPVGRRFADELGRLNQSLALRCDRVALVVAGQPVWVKQ